MTSWTSCISWVTDLGCKIWNILQNKENHQINLFFRSYCNSSKAKEKKYGIHLWDIVMGKQVTLNKIGHKSLGIHRRVPSYSSKSKRFCMKIFMRPCNATKNVKFDLQEAIFAFFMHISFWWESWQKICDIPRNFWSVIFTKME